MNNRIHALLQHHGQPRISTLVRASVALLSALFTIVVAARSQQNLQENQLQQFGAMQGFGPDSIDLTSLAVDFDVPLLQKPGRGENLNLRLSYRATSTLAQYLGWTTPLQNLVGRGSSSIIGCSNVGCGVRYHWVDPFGVTHGWQFSYGNNRISCTPCQTYDGSGLTLSPSLGSSPSTITATDGRSWNVIFSSGTNFTPGGYAADSNGNQITETATAITDTLGTTLQVQNFSPLTNPTNITTYGGVTSGTNPPSETYSYVDSNGNPQQVAINYALATVDNILPASPCASNYQIGSLYYGLTNLPSSISFPNGTAYSFLYETSSNTANTTTARVSQVNLPTGGTINYTYPSASSLIPSDPNCQDGGVFFLNRTTADGTWTYTRTLSNYGYGACVEAGNCSSYPSPIATTTVKDPKGNVTVYTFFPYTFDPWNNYTYFLTSKAVYNGPATGTPALYQQVCYNGFSPPCTSESSQNLPSTGQAGQLVSTKDVYTSYNGGPSSRVTTTYGWPLYVPTEVDEYDFGASTPVRKTFTTYYTMNGLMSNKPSSVVVKDGSNNILKQTQYQYDVTVATAIPGVPQHLAVLGQRGNLTAELEWRNTDGVWLATAYTNDDTGNRLSATDPKKNTPTQYSYSDSWYSGAAACPLTNTNAFLTLTTDPLGHKSTRAYDACTGLLRQERDPNDIASSRPGTITSYDEMNAVVSVNYPDGGGITTSYGGYAVPVTITTTKAATPDPSIVSETVMDAYGRTSKSIIGSDPSVAAETDTAYDKDGLVYSVSNPYQSTTDATYGKRYFYYDALGRKTQETAPDGTSQLWAYNGSTVTFTDESGNRWAKTSDGFGRLVKVLEPSGASQSPSMETDYGYDGLDNLLSVTQWGGASGSSGARARSFTYDSLSQLIQTYNPEAGWLCYGTTGGTAANGSNCTGGYDANGNLLYKTDARGVTISYSYDALNRLLSKSYSDGATSHTCNQYDSSSVANGIGRLLIQWTQSPTVGACSTSAAFLTNRVIGGYDPMGRTTNQTQYTPASIAAGTSYPLTYTYNLAGNLHSSTTGSGPGSTPITLTNTYDGAGRLEQVTSSYTNNGALPGTLFKPYTASAPCPNSITSQYTAFGSLANAQLGSGLTMNRAYDKRLHVNCEIDTGSIGASATSGSATVTITGSEQTQ